MFGEVAYVELESGVTEDTVREYLADVYPSFQRGQYVKSFSEMDWDLDSSEFSSENEFLAALGDLVGTSSNAAYSKEFGKVSTKDARSMT